MNKIYWDGKNEDGDLLGSGIYFFRIEAGDFVGKGKFLLVR